MFARFAELVTTFIGKNYFVLWRQWRFDCTLQKILSVWICFLFIQYLLTEIALYTLIRMVKHPVISSQVFCKTWIYCKILLDSRKVFILSSAFPHCLCWGASELTAAIVCMGCLSWCLSAQVSMCCQSVDESEFLTPPDVRLGAAILSSPHSHILGKIIFSSSSFFALLHYHKWYTKNK